MYSIRFTQIARAELIEAQDWYEAEAPGLGGRLREAIDALTERMSANPCNFPCSTRTCTALSCAGFRTQYFLSSKMTPCLSWRVFMPAASPPTGKSEREARMGRLYQ